MRMPSDEVKPENALKIFENMLKDFTVRRSRHRVPLYNEEGEGVWQVCRFQVNFRKMVFPQCVRSDLMSMMAMK